MNINKHIAKCIICAKIASDAGKGYFTTKIGDENLYNGTINAEYRTKDGFILEAIKAIKGTPNSAFRFWVDPCPGRRFVIAYFETKIRGKRKQISFHTFSEEIANNYTNKGRKTRWTHQSPQDTILICDEIIAFYDL